MKNNDGFLKYFKYSFKYSLIPLNESYFSMVAALKNNDGSFEKQ